VFTVPASHKKHVQDLLTSEGISFTCTGPCTKVSIVGAGMHGMQGVMARFSRALAKAGINMLQSVDSHATISGLVSREQRDNAVRVLHREFMESSTSV
jgi:aspartate kinase